MTSDDSYDTAGINQTVIRPRFGGRAAISSSDSSPQISESTRAGHEQQSFQGLLPSLDQFNSINPLVSSAFNVLSIEQVLRKNSHYDNPVQLFEDLVLAVEAFEQRVEQLGIDRSDVLIARYVLCAFVDEKVLSTPWGEQSLWVDKTLLSHFHKQAWGGERFFLVLDKLMQDAHKKLYLLELLYVLLCLGFCGKYKIHRQGTTELTGIRQRVLTVIRSIRGPVETGLSVHWQGLETEQSRLVQAVPLWTILALMACLLFVIYLGLSYKLDVLSDPGVIELNRLSRVIPINQLQLSSTQKRLAEVLAPEIEAEQLRIQEQGGFEVVVLQGDDFFASGQAALKVGSELVVQRLAQALGQTSGRIFIYGHTDNIPMRSVRFSSNDHLAQARAQVVADLLVLVVGKERIQAVQGKGAREPLWANTSPENRALNRRVEVMLRPEF